MALNQAFAYKAMRTGSVKAALFNSDVVNAAGAIVLDGVTNDLKLNLSASAGLQILDNALGIKLDTDKGLSSDAQGLKVVVDGDALQLGATGIDLKDTITGDRTFSNNLTIGGNLIVQGTTTTVDSTTVAIADKLIHINKADILAGGIPVPVGYTGLVIERGNVAAASEKRDSVGIIWDEANSKFVAGMLDPDDTPIDSKVDLEVANLIATEGISLAASKNMTLGAGALITDGSANGASHVTFAKNGADWGADNPDDVAEALDLLRAKIAATATGAAGDLVTYFSELRSNGILGLADIGAENAGDVDLFTGGRIAYVGGKRFELNADSFDAALLADGTFKLWLDDVGAVQSGAAYPGTGEFAKLGEIVVASGAVTSFTDEHLAMVQLDEKVYAVEAKIDNFITLIAGVSGAANVGISDALADDLGVAHGSTVEDAVQAIADLKMAKGRYTILAGDLTDGTNISNGYVTMTVPSYKVGSETMMVFVDGMAQDKPDFYAEVGAAGTYSTEIRLTLSDLVAGMKVLVWVAPFRG